LGTPLPAGSRVELSLSGGNHNVTRAGEVIGKIGLYDIDWAKREGERGVILEKPYWSQQYGREASRLFISYMVAKTSIDRIRADTFKANLRAQRAAAAGGFRIIGTETCYNPILNEHVEGVVMEDTRQDYCSHS
jgi:RimJ/RimL family protein N-acetyltransferase